MRERNIIFVIISIVIVFFIITMCMLWALATIKFGNAFLNDYNFCTSKGYDGVNWGGGYSRGFGKVECYSSFQGNQTTEVFDVKETLWGSLKENKK